MIYKLDYKSILYDYSSSELSEAITSLDIDYDFDNFISKIKSKEERDNTKDSIIYSILIGDDPSSPQETSLDKYLFEIEKFEKRNFKSNYGIYKDMTRKNRKMEIKPFLFRIGFRISIKSNKILPPEEMLDYKKLEKFILTGEGLNLKLQ